MAKAKYSVETKRLICWEFSNSSVPFCAVLSLETMFLVPGYFHAEVQNLVPFKFSKSDFGV